MRQTLVTLVGCAAALLATPLLSAPAHGSAWVVTNSADSGVGSLRALIEAANETPADETIVIPAGMTAQLSAPVPISGNLTITGAGPDSSGIQREGDDSTSWETFTQDAGSLSLERVSFDGGPAHQPLYLNTGWGDAAAELLWTDVRITRSAAAIHTSDLAVPLTLTRVTADNVDRVLDLNGGGPDTPYRHSIAVRDSSFANVTNTGISVAEVVWGSGSGIELTRLRFAGDGNFLVANVTADSTEHAGGAILTASELDVEALVPFHLRGQAVTPALPGSVVAEVTNSTIQGRMQSWVDGPDESWSYVFENATFVGVPSEPVLAIGNASVAMNHVTVEGILKFDGPGEITNSALIAPDGVAPVATSWGPSTVTGTGNAATTQLPEGIEGMVLPESDMRLGPLGTHDSAAQRVRMPASSSPLLNAAVPSPLTQDQRGLPRGPGVTADIGAVELQLPRVAVGDAGKVRAGEAAVFPVTVLSAGEVPATIEVATAPGTATEGTHYAPQILTLEVPAGEHPQSLALTVPSFATDTVRGKQFSAEATVREGNALLDPASGVATFATPARVIPTITPPTHPPAPPGTPPGPRPGAENAIVSPRAGATAPLARTGAESPASTIALVIILGALGAVTLFGAHKSAAARRTRSSVEQQE
ncbi:choice-of-anchor Q domain-containing protein [Leucobacter sp. 7(1)]|uniref:choice-of-anchor Q domain-containing protein n=1 Tax=Leucobacter sp. 7(1) TaxID=1255613 RepID=UPI000B35309B|nr:choice-of-anchor Q domain-containing protein [Leucobacter sp. 7(1)]